MATINIILRKDKIKKDGTAPLYFILYHNGKRTKISSKIYIDPKHWDNSRCKIKASAGNSVRLNNLISAKLQEMNEKLILGDAILNKRISTAAVREVIMGTKPDNFFELANVILSEYKTNNQHSNLAKCNGIMSKFEKYVGKKELMINEITLDFLKKYETYLLTELGNSINTVGKDMKFIRVVINRAIQSHSIEPGNNPFLSYKIKTEPTDKISLTEAELNAIQKVDLGENVYLNLHRDMFIFACYAGGMRISDVLKLRWSDYSDGRISFTTQKTSSQFSILLPENAHEIIKKYYRPKQSHTGFIFPQLKNGISIDNSLTFKKAIDSATTLVNKSLKFIAYKAKVNKPLHFHISRHTWATLALKKGMRLEHVSSILTHKTVKQTQVYAKMGNAELDKAMKDTFNN